MTHTLVYPITASHNAAGHLEIDGCDVVDLVADVRHAPARLRGEVHPRPVPPLHERLRANTPRISRSSTRARRSPRWRSPSWCWRRASPSTCRPAASTTWPRWPASRPRRSSSTATTRPGPSWSTRSPGGVGFVVVDSFQELALLEELVGARGERAEGPAAHHAGHRGAHALLHPDRAGGLQVRLRAGRRGGHGGHPARPWRRRISTWSVCTPTSAARSSSSTASARPSRSWWGSSRRPTRAFGFDCRYLNIGGGLGIRYTEEDTPSSIGDYAAVKVEGVREEMAARGPAHAAGAHRAGAVHRGQGRASPPTRWAPSRRSPGCAPT